jgi:hypothetical protein
MMGYFKSESLKNQFSMVISPSRDSVHAEAPSGNGW